MDAAPVWPYLEAAWGLKRRVSFTNYHLVSYIDFFSVCF